MLIAESACRRISRGVQCIHVAKLAKLSDQQWWLAERHEKQWTRDMWDAAYARYQLEKARSWYGGELKECFA